MRAITGRPVTRRGCVAGALAALSPLPRARAAEPLRIGLLHTLSPAPLYLAMRRGYFRDAGLDASFRFFEAAQPIAAAAVAGDVDVGVTALTGGFFALAAHGQLKVIAGALHERRGAQGSAILASDAAFRAGLTSPSALAGHSVAITQFGSSFQYMVGRIAEAEHIDPKAITLRTVQDVGNMIAAVRTGQVDATIAVASMARPLAARGEAHVIGWVGDLVPYQITAAFSSVRALHDRLPAVRGFVEAYRRGVADFRAAFPIGPDGRVAPGPATDAAVRDVESYVFTGDPDARAKILDGVGVYDEGAALDAADVAAQLRWFEAQGLLRGHVEPDEVIDPRFVAQQVPADR